MKMTVEKSRVFGEKMSRYPYIDRNPCIVAAGKSFGDPCETVKSLFQEVKLAEKVDVLKRQLGYVDEKSCDVKWQKPPEKDVSVPFTEIRHCIRPEKPTYFQAFEDEIKCTIYDSYWNKPVGHTRDQTPGLPAGMNPLEVTFGKPVDRSIAAGELINPPVKFEQLEAEERFYHDLYAFSHQDHYPGQQIRKCYKAPFNENSVFGTPSNKDETGSKVRDCLTWFKNDSICFVSRRLANMRNRYQPAVGKGLDKTGVTELFPEDHVYGKIGDTDFYGVEDLLNECPPSLMRRDMLIFLACANKLRQSVYKKISTGDITLEELYEEILTLSDDPEGGGCSVNFDCIDKVMKRHNIYLDRNIIEPLLLILGLLSEERKIKVRDFISFIDKNSLFPDLKPQFYILPPEFQTQKGPSRDPKDLYKTLSLPPAGIPSIRLDKPYPFYKDSIVNMNNLAEETSARAIISPSIYTQYGLSHRDFFQPRSKEFLGNLFSKIGVRLTDEDLDEIYNEGYELDKTGGVCVETFRNILDERVYNAYNRLIRN